MLYVDTMKKLKDNRDFVEQVRETGLKVNTKLIRDALACFDQREREKRKQQVIDPA
jgi:hypothetical protein